MPKDSAVTFAALTERQITLLGHVAKLMLNEVPLQRSVIPITGI